MSTATEHALKIVEAFKNDVSLLCCHLGGGTALYPFVITCADGQLLWGQRLPETNDEAGRISTPPEIVADKVVLTHWDGKIEELICQESNM